MPPSGSERQKVGLAVRSYFQQTFVLGEIKLQLFDSLGVGCYAVFSVLRMPAEGRLAGAGERQCEACQPLPEAFRITALRKSLR